MFRDAVVTDTQAYYGFEFGPVKGGKTVTLTTDKYYKYYFTLPQGRLV